MGKLPLVSVIVPSYNHEKYIEETIESIVNQTYKNIELIVIDDGSKDKSPKIIGKLSKKYGFIFLQHPNKGLSATLNIGIKRSTGKFITVCASDDIYLKDKVEKQVELMEQNEDCAICYGNTIKFGDSRGTEKIKVRNAKSGFVFKDILFQNFTMPAPSCMFKKEVFDHIGGFDEDLFVEDWDMYLRVTNKYKAIYLNRFLVYSRRHKTNISYQTSKIFNAELQTLNKWKGHICYKKAYVLWKLKWFNIYAPTKHKRKAFAYFIKNIQYFYYVRFIKGTIKLLFIGWR